MNTRFKSNAAATAGSSVLGCQHLYASFLTKGNENLFTVIQSGNHKKKHNVILLTDLSQT